MDILNLLFKEFYCNMKSLDIQSYVTFYQSMISQLSCEHYMNTSLQWRHNGRHSISNHQPHDRFLNRLFRHRSKKAPKLCVTSLCAGNSPCEFPAQMASNGENVSIWWRHHAIGCGTYISIIWGLVCQKQVSRAGTSNYIPQYQGM